MAVLTVWLDHLVIVIWEQNVPDFPPLNFSRRTAGSLAAHQLDCCRAIDARLGIVVRNVAHLLLGLALMIPELLSRPKVAGAPVADKRRRVVSLMLLHNVLPVERVGQQSGSHQP